jgi:trans-aconitate 2-methyltransferase
MRDAWSPDTYERFKEERSQPFYDLCAMVRPQAGMRVLDLGSGPGDLTKHFHEKLGARETIGIDASENMLAQAKPREGNGLRFVKGKIEELPVGGEFDLIFSNAALQWVENHERLFGEIAKKLAPGGQFAMQVPYNEESQFHAAARDVAGEFSGPLGGYVRHLEALAPDAYARLLFRLGFAEQEVVLRVYPHVLPSLGAVVEWYRGTLLTTYESRLDAETFARFVARYQEVLRERFEDVRPFFFPFPRILLWAKL